MCTFVGVLAVLCLLALAPKQTHEPRGIILPAKTVRAPTLADQVVVYQQIPAGHVEELGRIRIEFAYHTLTSETHDAVMNKVKALAASVGANGVVVNLFVPSDGLRRILVFMGDAVYVPSSSARSAKS